MNDREQDPSGRFSYDGLHRTLHERARLSIMTSLMSNPDGLLFNDLKVLCDLSDGNLSRHLSVLEESNLIDHETKTSSDSGHEQTLYRVTAEGTSEYLAYLDELERLVEDAHSSTAHRTDTDEDHGASDTSFSPAT